MMTNTNKLTDTEIRNLCTEVARAGDLRMAAICVLALGGRGALRGADPGTEHARLFSSRRGQKWARQQCAAAISSADAMRQS